MKYENFFPNIFSDIPQIKILFNCLLKDGSELRIVGGAVRDLLSNNKINDIDFVCKYLPEKTIEILNKNNIKTIPSGIKYGTITAVVSNNSNNYKKYFQITTIRKDLESFGRDCKIEFINDFYEDAKRRDFTINAMSVDYDGNLYDYFGGKKDLENKEVKFIGNAEERIKEDYLRILRFFRFSCFYGKNKIDENAFKACLVNCNLINKLSAKRIRDEFFKILSCQNRDNLFYTFSKMEEAKILNLVLGDKADLLRLRNVLDLEKFLNYNFEPLILLASLSYNPAISLSKSEKKYLKTITSNVATFHFKMTKPDLLWLLFSFDKKIILDIFLIKLASNKNYKMFINDFLRIKNIISSVLLPDFPINGNDLILAGIENKNIGKVLKNCRRYWLDNNFCVKKDQIINYALKAFDKQNS